MADGILNAWEMNASEEELGAAEVENGELVFNIAPYAPKTFAVELKPFGGEVKKAADEAVRLVYNTAVTSPNHKRANGVLGGCTIPAELFGSKVNCKDTVFELSTDRLNAVRCGGQTIHLPAGAKSVTLLVTSVKGDRTAMFRSGDAVKAAYVPDCFEALGAWDLYSMGEKGYIKQCTLAKEFTHMHNAQGDVIAKQCYLFAVDVPATDTYVTLPVDENLLVFAATAHFEDRPEAL